MLLVLLALISPMLHAQSDDYAQRYQLKQMRDREVAQQQTNDRIYASNHHFLGELAKLSAKMQGIQSGSLRCFNTFRSREATQEVYEQCHDRIGCTKIYSQPNDSYGGHLILHCSFSTGLNLSCWSQMFGNKPAGVSVSCLDPQGYETKYQTGRYVETPAPKSQRQNYSQGCYGYRLLTGQCF